MKSFKSIITGIIILSAAALILTACGSGGGGGGGGGGNNAVSSVSLPQTGQTTSYATGDDGSLKKGVAWPSPRFADNANGTVTDNLTGLIWLKNANCFFSQRTWTQALSDANNLANGQCSLTDGSSAGNWRLPNVNELESLINAEQTNSAAWLNGQGFTNVLAYYYWSSTTNAGYTGRAWVVDMYRGIVDYGYKFASNDVWPVRAGQ